MMNINRKEAILLLTITLKECMLKNYNLYMLTEVIL